MLRVTHAKVYGLDYSMVASGYPMKADLDSMMDIGFGYGEKDELRAKKLAKAPIGAGHDNFLNGVVVQFDLMAPVKVWTEAQRYHFLDFVSSQSTMHRLVSMNFDEVFDEYVDDFMIARMKILQKQYNEMAELDLPTKKEAYLKLLMSCPVGLNLTARMTTNYRQLKTIYQQRKNHRLPHWHVFCDWIKSLPMSELITGEGLS